MNPWMLVGISIVAAVVSQLLFKAGVSAMDTFDMSLAALPGMFGSVLANGYIASGLIFYALGFWAWLGALSKLALSQVYPFTSLNYLLITLLSWVFLGESVSVQKGFGILIVCVGLVLVAKG